MEYEHAFRSVGLMYTDTYPSLGYPFRCQLMWGKSHPALKAYSLPRIGAKSSGGWAKISSHQDASIFHTLYNIQAHTSQGIAIREAQSDVEMIDLSMR